MQSQTVDSNVNETQGTSTILEVDRNDSGSEKKDKPSITIDAKDFHHLRKNRYHEERRKWTTTFVLQNLRHPEKIVELKAASAYHACKMIHWKANQTRVLAQHTDVVPDVLENVHKAWSERSLGHGATLSNTSAF